MKTLLYSYLLLPLLGIIVFACGKDDSPVGPLPSTIGLDQIMDGEQAWRVASVTSDRSVDFDGTITTDWFSQMAPCLNDDPIIITYEVRDEQISPDVMDIEVRTAQGIKCSTYEPERDLIVLGKSLERLERYELSPVTVIHAHLYGYTDPNGSMTEVWSNMTFSADSITYTTTKVIDQENYEVRVKLVPM